MTPTTRRAARALVATAPILAPGLALTLALALALTLMSAVSPTAAVAQTADCDRPRTGGWSSVALPPQPATGGTRWLAVDPTNADRMVVDASGAFFHTADGGCTWQASTLDIPQAAAAGRTVWGLAFSPDGSTVLARVTGVQFASDRILRSTDGGATFTLGPLLAPTPAGTAPAGVVFGGDDASTVYTLSRAGVLEVLLDGSYSTLQVSTDGGMTFTSRAVPVDDGAGISEVRLVADPTAAGTIYLKYSSTRDPAVVHRSRDAGASWEALEVPVTPGEHIGHGDDAVSVTPVAGGPARLTVVEEYQDDALPEALRHVSDDDGATWTTQTLPTPPHTTSDHLIGGSPDVEMVLARHFYPSSTPGTRALIRRGTASWTDVSLPDLGHLEQLQRTIDPTTGRLTAWALGRPGAGTEGGGDPGQDVLWRFEGSLAASGDGTDGPALARLAGPERIATSVAVSGDLYGPGQAGSVVLARADAFPDALTGSPLAVAGDAPLLLTSASRLSDATAAELRRVLPLGATVQLLGGPDALSEQVATDVTALGYVPERIAGPTRFDTAVAIAETTTADPATILIADGGTFPDALVAGAAASTADGVVVLTDGTGLPQPTRDYLDRHPDAEVITIGATAAAALPDAPTLGSSDPVATAVAVAQRFHPTPRGIGLASAATFPDGLSGGAHAGHTGIPLLLTPPDQLPQPLADHLAGLTGITRLTVYGGPAAITEGTVADARTRAAADPSG